ncbi:PREDICTED: fidgetin-like [Eufriesea mexicana]|uniref:fidgetin-like n=1 Tax=Eufriesea mexicana TaxID=516756 RepID=UPI00083BDF71|nr:PREDICTED: fidgetin-like [Eufriesea mexicana]
MKAFVTFLLVASLIAISASASIKKFEKRGLLNDNGYSGGHDSHDTSVVVSPVVEPTTKYLPPVAPVKKPYAVSSLSVPSYSVPEHLPESVPAQSYGVPSHSASYSVAEPAPSYGLPVPSYSAPVSASLPSYSAHVSAPLPSYSAHVSASLPSYSAHAPSLLPSYSAHTSVPSSTYGLPSHSSGVVLNGPALASTASLSVPHSVSVGSGLGSGLGLASVGVPSSTYGVPSSVHSGYSSGLSLSSLSVPSKTYGLPSSAMVIAMVTMVDHLSACYQAPLMVFRVQITGTSTPSHRNNYFFKFKRGIT